METRFKMREKNLICPLKFLMNTFGGKWKMPIICILSGDKPQRYSMIKRRLRNITNMMLSQSLKELEADGMIHREQFNEVPPRVEYSLTQRGRSSLPFLTEAAKWAADSMNVNGMKTFCSECVNIC